MTLAVIALVLGAAVSHATWNLAAKRASGGGLAFVWLAALVATVAYAPLAVVFAHPLSLAAVAVIGLSGVLHLGYFLLLQRGYVVADLSVVYPMARGSGPLLSVFAAILLLGEMPPPIALLGAGLVVAGIVIIGAGAVRRGTAGRGAGERSLVGNGSAATTDDPPVTDGDHSGRIRAGVGYGLAAGVLIACYTVLDAAAVQTLLIAPLFFDWCSNAIRWALVSPYAVKRPEHVSRVWREHWREVLIVAILGPLGYILVLYAFTLADVSRVAPARELSIVVGVLFGWLLLREPQGARRVAGAAIVVVGVIALALS